MSIREKLNIPLLMILSQRLNKVREGFFFRNRFTQPQKKKEKSPSFTNKIALSVLSLVFLLRFWYAGLSWNTGRAAVAKWAERDATAALPPSLPSSGLSRCCNRKLIRVSRRVYPPSRLSLTPSGHSKSQPDLFTRSKLNYPGNSLNA